jgi:hydroxymethylpyrimidine pyrophosphatase-like HAD family hydrolase
MQPNSVGIVALNDIAKYAPQGETGSFSAAPEWSSMRYTVLACDYDGTIAAHGRVAERTVEALARLRGTGRKLILVTGRELEDLQRVFSHLGVFDRVVVENGAVLYTPASGNIRTLVPPPPPEFFRALQHKGVSPLSAGRVIVATWTPNETKALEAIRDLGLELQVIFNKGAVMVLPAGVNKGTGLGAALEDLGLSPHNCAAIGDAENDHAFLAMSECAVAVVNALPALKQHADMVTTGADGDGVTELIGRLIDSDLADVELGRHELVIGTAEDGSEVRLPPYCRGVAVAGPSGSGKSTIATTILERLAAAGYQFCLVDPEGDYEDCEPAIIVRGGGIDVMVREALDVLSKPDNHAVINVGDLAIPDRPLFFERLFPRLQELRARRGRPHWIVVDEVHQFLPAGWARTEITLPSKTYGLLMITAYPERVASSVLSLADIAIVLGPASETTLGPIGRSAGKTPPGDDLSVDLAAGEALVWRVGSPYTRRFTVAPPRSARRRHRKKYAEGEIVDYRSFYFRGPEGKLNLRAHNLSMFVQIAEGIDDDTWTFHLRQRDYSRWFQKVIKDEGLAAEAALVEEDRALPPGESRVRICRAVTNRYTAPA